MAGTITATTIQNDTSSPPTFRNNSVEIGRLCRAWVNFNGSVSTPTIRSSFNVSSVTKNSTGDFTLNFTTAMPNTDYAACLSGRFQLTSTGGSTNGRFLINVADAGMATTSLRVACVNAGDTAFLDPVTYCAAVFSS